MLKAFLFDFNATLIHSPVWMDLEVRSLPQQAFSLLASQDHIAPITNGQMSRAEAVFKEARKQANESLRETSHIDDLTAMVRTLKLEQQISPQLIKKTVEALHRRCVPGVKLIEGATDTLTRLQKMGYRLSIISNAAYGPFLLWTLEHFGLLDLFEQVVVSADVGIRKPDLGIFQLALDRMNLKPGEAAYVGDDFIKDILPAREMGMRAIWFPPEGDDNLTPEEQQTPDALISHLSEIPALAGQWRQVN